MAARQEDGFTLVELIVSLALFALIAMAGLGMVEGLLSIQARTDGRLERLGDIQRAMYLLSADLEQIADAPLVGGVSTVSFRRHAVSLDGRGAPVRLALVGGTLVRRLPGVGTQRLLTGVEAIRLRYLSPAGVWQPAWPAIPEQAALRPAAIELEVALAGGQAGAGGLLRRVVALPVRPPPPPREP